MANEHQTVSCKTASCKTVSYKALPYKMLREALSLSVAIVALILSTHHGSAAAQDESEQKADDAVRFETWNVHIDARKPLAAYQFELVDSEKRTTISGLEGGDRAPFKDAPYYNPAALSRGRLIVADFDTGTDLPEGKVLVSRLHLMVRGDGEPDLEVKLIVAADAAGERVPAAITLTKGESK